MIRFRKIESLSAVMQEDEDVLRETRKEDKFARDLEPEDRCPVCAMPISTRVYRKSDQQVTRVPPRDDMKLVAFSCRNGHISVAEDEDWQAAA